MARRKHGSIPGLRHHRPSGKAVVTLSCQDFYCGTFGTKTSLLEYDRQVAEWLARGRRPLITEEQADAEITVVELIAAYKRHAEGYYRKDGEITSEVSSILAALRVLKQLYAREPASSIGPLKLAAVQQAMIQKGWNRLTINHQTARIVRMYRWGVAQELVRADVADALRHVGGLHKGRTEAREPKPVLPVTESVVDATLPHVPPIVADMIRLQRLTGCRPEEVCLIRPADLDTSGPVWAYRPESHKTQHLGRSRVIGIGPRGQQVLQPYLNPDKLSYCFSPHESEQQRRAVAHQARKTPLHYGNRPGTNKSNQPKRPAGDRYDTNSYRKAIQRGCELAFAMPESLRRAPKQESPEQRQERRKAAIAWRAKHCWSPNQLRHLAATEIRNQFGLEAAQVVLGHSAADVTQIYAERDQQKALSVMAQVG